MSDEGTVTVQLRPKEREAYQLARVLVAATYALTEHRRRQADRQLELRQAAVSAALDLLSSGNETSAEGHLACLERSLLSLHQLEQLVEAGRLEGELPADRAGRLLAIEESLSEAVDEAMEEWRGSGVS